MDHITAVKQANKICCSKGRTTEQKWKNLDKTDNKRKLLIKKKTEKLWRQINF